MVMCRFGGYREGDTHDPIPNSTVKPLRAYDTMTQVMGKSVAAKSTHYHSGSRFQEPGEYSFIF